MLQTTTDRFMTRAEVERRVGLGRSAIYAMMRDGRFPEPFRLGPKCVRWSAAEITTWMQTRPRSRGDLARQGA